MTTFQKIIQGLTIINEHDPDTDFCADHDQIWCGDIRKFPADAKNQLENLGWFDNENSWSHFC